MLSDLFLNDEELEALTGKKTHPAQANALKSMGVEHRVRPDGKPLVLRAYINQEWGYKEEATEQAKEFEPNLDWMNA